MLGIIWILLGLIAMTHPVGASIAVTKLTGWCLMIAGLISFGAGVTNRTQGSRWWPLIAGPVMVFVGYDLVFRPLTGTITLTMLVVLWMIVDGVMGSLAAIMARNATQAWKWALASSLITVVLGIALWNDFPTSAAWLLGTYAGIVLMLRGMVSIMTRPMRKAVD